MPSPEPLGRGPTALVRGPASARARRRTGFPHAPVVRSLASNASGSAVRTTVTFHLTGGSSRCRPQCMDAHVGNPECQRRRSVHHDPGFQERLHQRAYSLVPLIRTRRRSNQGCVFDLVETRLAVRLHTQRVVRGHRARLWISAITSCARRLGGTRRRVLAVDGAGSRTCPWRRARGCAGASGVGHRRVWAMYRHEGYRPEAA
jgi:hypothetical protein